jgi:hypothetical protein
MREFSEPVEASADIPLDQRDWCCPFCTKALPSLGKALKEKSVKHHYKTFHPRRKIEAGRLTKIRWKLAKTDLPRLPITGREKCSLAKKLKQHAVARRDLKERGHNISLVPVDWTNWPRDQRYAYRKGDSLYTCVRCRTWKKNRWSYDCKGLVDIPAVAHVKAWYRLQVCPENQRALCKVWGIPWTEADCWFARQKKVDPNKCVSKHSVKKQWKRRVVEEGIEPNPGPVRPGSDNSKVTVASLNCQGANGCWAALEQMDVGQMAQVLCLQEVRMWPNEMVSFKAAALRRGYHCYYNFGISLRLNSVSFFMLLSKVSVSFQVAPG